MANGGMPDPICLEDLHDLADIFEETGRTILREKWADECVEIDRARRRKESDDRFF